MMGRAVSPVTSYVAFEPGTRPSTVGLERTGSGFGVDSGSGMGRGAGVMVHRVTPDPMALVADAAKQCVVTHKPPAGWKVDLTMESTYDEVVDVIVDSGTGPLASCLVEAVWAADLTSAYDQARETFQLSFH